MRGPWRGAVWNFYERLTDVAFWWRVLKAVGKLLLRFLPLGRDPEPSRVVKAIRGCVRDLPPDTRFPDLPSRTNSEAKKPDANPAA